VNSRRCSLVGVAAFVATALGAFGSASALACSLCCNQSHVIVFGDDPPPAGGGRFGGSGQAGFDIQIVAGAGLAGNSAALAAFERAAAQWEARISDNMTVVINADFEALDPGVLGEARTSLRFFSYTTARNAMVTDAGNEVGDDDIVNFLPTTFRADIPSNLTLSTDVLITQANARALGLVGETTSASPDSRLRFNTDFNFDFDASDGTTSGFFDFETVAVHEIGHALGFSSYVDFIAAGRTEAVTPLLMDLFRFRNGVTGRDPSSAGEFRDFNRYLVPDSDHIFDDIFAERRLSTAGDGNQASHWKDDDQNGGVQIGVMDPIYDGRARANENDFRLLDLLGYEISGAAAIPEPTLLPAFLLGLAVFRRKKKSVVRSQKSEVSSQ
jgi:hypothetical protein